MKMILKTEKYLTEWNEDKVVMLPKLCSEVGKLKSENWRPITLTNTMYSIIFGRIADYFQELHKEGKKIVDDK
jgi:hypothetical protein